MPSQLGTQNKIYTVDEHGMIVQWPRIWIMVLGITLIFLCFSIAGMEIGNTVLELRRATAFGGFIVFLPLLGYGIFIIVIAFKPRLIFRRIAMILSITMIILCLILIAYDIVIVVDPTRCFFFDCNTATINISNSTNNVITSGYPVNTSWPSYFQINMNAKRIFQSIQMLCAGLFILFTALYLLTDFIYQAVNSHQKEIYNVDQRQHKTTLTPTKYSNDAVHSYPPYSLNHLVTTYAVGDQPSASKEYRSSPKPAVIHTKARRTTKKTTYARPPTNSADASRLCTRCLKEPRIAFTADRGRKNYFSHLCVYCNDELLNYQQQPSSTAPRNNRARKN